MPGLSYGPVRMIDVVTKSYTQEAVYNGPDFIHVKHTLIGTATVHPYLLDNALAGGPYANAIDAVTNIKLAFLQPRQSISFEVGLVPFVAMAPSGDVQNGPEPLFFEAIQVQGQKTILANFGISWYTITDNDRGAPPITSNRWVMSHEYDDQFRLTITTRGVATFRRDALTLYGTSADDYRQWLMIPIPAGYRRLLGPITMSQDGLSVEYQTRDVRNLMDAFTPVLAHLKLTTSVQSVSTGLSDMIRDTAAGAAAGLGAAAAGFLQNPFAAAAAGAIGVGLALYDRLPRTRIEVVAVGTGAPTSPAWAIYSATLQVMMAKFYPEDNDQIPYINRLGASSKIAAVMDHEARTCTLVWTYELSPIETLSVTNENGEFDPSVTLSSDIPETWPFGIVEGLTDATSNFLVYENMFDTTGVVYGNTQAFGVGKGPGQDGTGPEMGRFGYIGSDILEVLVCQALQPARPAGNTVNPPKAPPVTGMPVLLTPEGRK